MVKIGIIVSNKSKKNKVKRLIKYLKQHVNVSIYRADRYLLSSTPKHYFDEDLFFVKGKGELVLNLVKTIENLTSTPVINSSKGIWLAINRFLNTLYLKKEGIPVPDFDLIPKKMKSSFKDFIIKNIIDQTSSSFKPSIKMSDGHLHVSDERALIDAESSKLSYHYYFYQKFIHSKWEYKIYGIDDQLFYYKQIPIIRNPHKIHPKVKIDEIPELGEHALKAMKTINLKLASVDFLKSKEGKYYLTDINSGPNFSTIENGYEIVGKFLLDEIKK